MKLLLVIVSVIAVLPADCRDLAGEPEDNGSDEILGHDYSEELQLKEKEHNKRELRRSRCKARNACVVMGGFCVTNATLCSGRLVAEGCKGNNCQCCVPGTLELKIQSLEMELQSMKNNLNDSNKELKMEIQSLKSNNTDANSELKMELQAMGMNMTNGDANMEVKLDSVKDAITNQDSDINALKTANSNQASKLNTIHTAISNQESKLNSINTAISSQDSKINSIKELQECSGGFLISSQCFRLYMDTTRTWTSARSKCQSAGLRLAEPTEAVAVPLRKYVIDNYGSIEVWLGAKGNGYGFVWDKQRSYLYKESPLWDDGPLSSSAMSSSYCLELDALQSEWDHAPGRPYDYRGCTSSLWTLCEVVRE